MKRISFIKRSTSWSINYLSWTGNIAGYKWKGFLMCNLFPFTEDDFQSVFLHRNSNHNFLCGLGSEMSIWEMRFKSCFIMLGWGRRISIYILKNSICPWIITRCADNIENKCNLFTVVLAMDINLTVYNDFCNIDQR